MSQTDSQRAIARRFLEVIPPLLHGVGSELRCAGEYGPITIPQFRSMAALHQTRCSLNELAQLHRVSAPTMSRLISTLVERGWVRREPDPADRRQVVLSLTPSGETMWAALRERGIQYLARLLSALTPEELDALETALGGLARVAPERHCVRYDDEPVR